MNICPDCGQVNELDARLCPFCGNSLPVSWQVGGLPLLNVAAICRKTRALGPGVRSVVWVQGCPFRCRGCIAPEWIPLRPARLVSPEDLANELPLAEVDGLTFSGGEPMLQAAGLARLAQLARQVRPNLSIICYTGFTLEELTCQPPYPGVTDLLQQTDVLIDGLYVEELNDDRGLRGSSNQRIHFLTDRLKGEDLESCVRRVEVHVQEEYVLLVGIPSRQALKAFEVAVQNVLAKGGLKR